MVIHSMRWLAFLVSTSLLFFYFKGGTIIINDTKHTVETTGQKAYLFFVAILGAAGILILASQAFICLGLCADHLIIKNPVIVFLGTILVIVGISTVYIIRFTYLREFWSGSVDIKENHRIITSGPYRYIRHPIYAQALFIYPGAAMAFSVWWNWIACIVMAMGYIWLIHYEDQYLQHALMGYKKYARQTKYKMIPGLW